LHTWCPKHAGTQSILPMRHSMGLRSSYLPWLSCMPIAIAVLACYLLTTPLHIFTCFKGPLDIQKPDSNASSVARCSQSWSHAQRRGLTSVMTLQMWTSAAKPTMDTLTRCCLATLMVSWMLPGSQVDRPAKSIRTCIVACSCILSMYPVILCTCILVYLYTCILVYLYTCTLVYLYTTCILYPTSASSPAPIEC